MRKEPVDDKANFLKDWEEAEDPQKPGGAANSRDSEETKNSLNEEEEIAECLKSGEEAEDLGRADYRIIQKKGVFRFGTDAVLLAWFAAERQKPGASVMDLCTGSGIVPLLMDARRQDEKDRYTGLEIQADMAEMAGRSVCLNDCQARIRIEEGDVRKASEIYGKHSFDAVTCNPPYIKTGSGLVNPDSNKAVSRHEILCTLEDAVREGSALLKMNGRFYMVHRPFRLQDIMNSFERNHLAASSVLFVHPAEDKEASLLLIEGVKGGSCETRILPPLVLYQKDGSPSEALRKVYEN